MDTTFNCPFCGHEKTVDCNIIRDSSVGVVECRVCGAKHECVINHLEEEIDVYSRWIDALEEMQDKVREEVGEEEAKLEEEVEKGIETRNRGRKRSRSDRNEWDDDEDWDEVGAPSRKIRKTRAKPAIIFSDDDIDE